MYNKNAWQLDEDEEQAGKQLIVSRENVNGFNPQREGHGNIWIVALTLIIPIVAIIAFALFGHLPVAIAFAHPLRLIRRSGFLIANSPTLSHKVGELPFLPLI